MKPFYVTNPTGDKGPMARLLQRPTPDSVTQSGLQFLQVCCIVALPGGGQRPVTRATP